MNLKIDNKKELTKIDILKLLITLISGSLTIILKQFVPIGSGGISLVFVLTIPILIGLSLIFTVIQYFLIIRNRNEILTQILFVIFQLILIGLTLVWYPYK